jgi:acetoin utilization deacetylase AcuC-like enzyme
MNKFIDSAKRLVEDGTLLPSQIIDPGLIAEEDLLRVHTSEYVQSIGNGNYYGITKRKLGLPWSPELNIRSRTAAAGTIRASEAAAQFGISCNLAGGTHHAFPDHGEGYCVFNDIAIAVKKLHFSAPSTKILIVDLDAHQGNGTHFILGKERACLCFLLCMWALIPLAKYRAQKISS